MSECLTLGGRHAAPGHVRLLLDCAELCQTVTNFLLRGSTLAAGVCSAAAEACARSATECTRLGLDACAEACDRCAESCERLADAPADAKPPFEKPDHRSYVKWSSGGERGQGRDSGTGPPLPG